MKKDVPVDVSRIIGLAWADDVSFDLIYRKTGLAEKEVIVLMRTYLKPSSFRLWRKRVSGRRSKHSKRAEHLALKDASGQIVD